MSDVWEGFSDFGYPEDYGLSSWDEWDDRERPEPEEPTRTLDDADADRMVADDAEYEHRTTEGAET